MALGSSSIIHQFIWIPGPAGAVLMGGYRSERRQKPRCWRRRRCPNPTGSNPVASWRNRPLADCPIGWCPSYATQKSLPKRHGSKFNSVSLMTRRLHFLWLTIFIRYLTHLQCWNWLPPVGSMSANHNSGTLVHGRTAVMRRSRENEDFIIQRESPWARAPLSHRHSRIPANPAPNSATDPQQVRNPGRLRQDNWFRTWVWHLKREGC